MGKEFIYEPSAEWIEKSWIYRLWKSQAGLSLKEFRERCAEDTEWFWSIALKDSGIFWDEPFSELLSSGLPWPKWAQDGKLSIVNNCIDRHLHTRATKTAAIFESDDARTRHSWTYGDLARESSYIASLLEASGARPGDRAAVLMPMSLEMLASFFGILRAGLTVVPIFSGYGREAVKARLLDAEIQFAFVQEKTFRRAKEIPVCTELLELQKDCPKLKKVFSLKREDFLKGHSCELRPAHSFAAEDECLLLYTSGTTGKPKACVHTSFGVLAITAKEHRYAFDLKENDTFFWYTDIGWMMGPWELFGSLQFGASVVLFEGVPDFPNTNRIWEILRDHRVSQFGISPTAIRVLKKAESDFLSNCEFENLRILGSTGEPWDEESWHWYFKNVGKSRCPVINISGGTEIMGCLLSPDPLSPLKPASLAQPALGVRAEAWSEDGKALQSGLGHLVCLSPLPSMTKGFLGNKEKYIETYFSRFGEDVWYHGDWAYIDKDGQWFLRGRSDDTIKIAGKRVGPNEYESALMEDHRVQEAAAVGLPHEVKGECVHCFVVLKESNKNPQTADELLKLIQNKMGKALGAERIIFVNSLPKTRSGKILRSLIRKVILGESSDASAAENPQSLIEIKKVIANG